MTIFDQNMVDYESVSLRFFKNLLKKKDSFGLIENCRFCCGFVFFAEGFFFERFCKFRGFLSSWGSWGYFRFLRDISPILRIRFHFEEILWGSWEISWRNFKRCFEILEDSSRLIKFLEGFFSFLRLHFLWFSKMEILQFDEIFGISLCLVDLESASKNSSGTLWNVFRKN